jgi:3-dehydroquinate dehydratase-2
LGKRETDIYGNESFDLFFPVLQSKFPDVTLIYFQSNMEGELVTYIQQCGFSCNGIVLNPAAYSHTSLAIADAVAAIPCKTVEVHISNIFAREAYRHHSFISSKVTGVIGGLGLQGYELAIRFLTA